MRSGGSSCGRRLMEFNCEVMPLVLDMITKSVALIFSWFIILAATRSYFGGILFFSPPILSILIVNGKDPLFYLFLVIFLFSFFQCT